QVVHHGELVHLVLGVARGAAREVHAAAGGEEVEAELIAQGAEHIVEFGLAHMQAEQVVLAHHGGDGLSEGGHAGAHRLIALFFHGEAHGCWSMAYLASRSWYSWL